MNHCSSEQLLGYLDRSLNGKEKSTVHDHLEACSNCARAYESMARIDASLRKIRLESVQPEFTQSIMSKVETLTRSPMWYKLLGNLGYFLGLLFVLGVMAVMFALTGVVNPDQVSQTQNVISGVMSGAGNGVSLIVAGFTDSLRQFFPFIFVKGSLGITLFGVFLALFLGGVDRLLRRRFVHRA